MKFAVITMSSLFTISLVFIGAIQASEPECFKTDKQGKIISVNSKQKISCTRPILDSYCGKANILQSCDQGGPAITKIYNHVTKKYPNFDKCNFKLIKQIVEELIQDSGGLAGSLFSYKKTLKKKPTCGIEVDSRVRAFLENGMNLVSGKGPSCELSQEDTADVVECFRYLEEQQNKN